MLIFLKITSHTLNKNILIFPLCRITNVNMIPTLVEKLEKGK